jgi:hypothetical protein
LGCSQTVRGFGGARYPCRIPLVCVCTKGRGDSWHVFDTQQSECVQRSSSRQSHTCRIPLVSVCTKGRGDSWHVFDIQQSKCVRRSSSCQSHIFGATLVALLLCIWQSFCRAEQSECIRRSSSRLMHTLVTHKLRRYRASGNVPEVSLTWVQRFVSNALCTASCDKSAVVAPPSRQWQCRKVV